MSKVFLNNYPLVMLEEVVVLIVIQCQKKKLTHEKFVKRLKETHSNLEVLSTYNGIDKPITVRCTIHNHIWTTTPHRLKQGSNCQKML